jgi:hypothetical protein
MVLGNIQVLISLLEPSWLVSDLEVLGVFGLEVLSFFVLLGISLGDVGFKAFSLLLLLLDELVSLDLVLLHILNHTLETGDLRPESLLLSDLLLVDAGDDVFLLQLKLVLLAPLELPHIVAVLNLLFDLVHLVVELLEHGLVFSLLALGLLKLEQLIGQVLLELPCSFHEDLLVLHVLNKGLVKFVELLFGLVSAT